MSYQKMSLNGTWKLQPGKCRPQNFEYQVPVPGLVDLTRPNLIWKKYKYFWYKYTFRIDKTIFGQKILLQLEQVKYGTRVLLNGHSVGGDIPCYTSQEFDVTPYIKEKSENILIIRVGAKSTLPKGNVSGSDFEKISFIPGIWGDVWLHFYGSARFKWTRIIPDIDRKKIMIHSEIENFSASGNQVKVTYTVREKSTGKVVVSSKIIDVTLNAVKVKPLDTEIDLGNNIKLWSPETPFLYILEEEIADSSGITHHKEISFGMRQFEIKNGNFYLNGKRRVLFGSNIAFHRMLSDETRDALPWNLKWVKRVLVDIPKAHNMFFFRFHLGHAYNRWYDLADEYGIMLQDEWMSWNLQGSNEQFRQEFTAWVKENINHPSIVIWDPLNESDNAEITEKLIPELKKIDPTRPWEVVDFHEDHPYIYSLGPVLNSTKFGFSRSVFDLKNSVTPTMVNEYIWWWLDKDGNPTPLTKIVLQRWLGKNPDQKQILEHQSFLARELTELWRRLNLDAIMPFVYLSLRDGATANWFFGDLSELRPKPILAALRNAFSPLGISLELWDRHFVVGEKRRIPLYLFNDTEKTHEIYYRLKLKKQANKILFEDKALLQANEHKVLSVNFTFPEKATEDTLIAELFDSDGKFLADSRKPVLVFEKVSAPRNSQLPVIILNNPSKEIRYLFEKNKLRYLQLPEIPKDARVVYVDHNGLDDRFFSLRKQLTKFVSDGGILILQEPSFGIKEEKEIPVLDNLSLYIRFRQDADRGGYDSYVFIQAKNRGLWTGLQDRYLQMFNGGFGGEIVSQYNIRPTLPFMAAASCNLSLKVPAVLEIPYGRGWVIISRIQTRGRLKRNKEKSGLFDRRYDPVAEQYFWNLLKAYVQKEYLQREIKKKLNKKTVYISRARASSGEIYDAIDGKMITRWSSEAKDPQWLWLDLGRKTTVHKITIYWEAAYGREYKILISDDNTHWHLVYSEDNSDGKVDVIELGKIEARYLKMEFIRRGTQWGYSIWELEIK